KNAFTGPCIRPGNEPRKILHGTSKRSTIPEGFTPVTGTGPREKSEKTTTTDCRQHRITQTRSPENAIHSMPTHHGGRHEHGQNHLADGRVVARVLDLVRDTDGPLLEIGPGTGALTLPLQDLGRPLTAVEIDGRRVE